MKRRFAALLMVIALAAGVSPALADADDLSTNLSASTQVAPEEPVDTPDTSLPDLPLLGTIALGVIGLFWIRRHTSEL